MIRIVAALALCAFVATASAGTADDLDAARAAERAGDYAGAIRHLEAVAASAPDDITRTRARADIARLSALVGDAGEWTDVARQHDQLAATIRAGGDPRAALRALGELVRAHPGYPGATAARLVIAQGWEREGHSDQALVWLREAVATAAAKDRTHATAELARTLIRAGDLADAERAIAGIADGPLAASLRAEIAKVERRRAIRWGVAGLLLLLVVLAAFQLRRAGWRRLRRPPAEAIFYLPVGALLAIVAQFGNPLVARAVLLIAMAGGIVVWVTGALLDAGRSRLRTVAVAALAMLCAAYLVVDREHLIDLLLETWRSGPSPR